MYHANSFWNPGNVETLKTLLADGHSTREIASKLGITRNSVIGKARRLGLSYPHKPGRTRNIRPRKQKPLPFIARRILPPRKPSGPVHFRALGQHHCRWMPGEPSILMYCGTERSEGSPYCSAHTRASYSRSLSG